MARKMKDSGIPWVGKIPEGWEVTRLNNCLSEVLLTNRNGSIKNALKFYFGTLIEKDNFDPDTDSYVAETIKNYTVVRAGDLVINGLNLNFDLVSLRVAQATSTGVITSAYIVMRPIVDRLSSDYGKYLLKSYDFKKAFHNMGTGVRKILTFTELKKALILHPPLSEQKRIAEYLDKTVGLIDGLREKISREIERLGDYKKSMISEAVCRGLDKTAKMKDSGIPWVGKIPEGWEVSPLYKYVTQVKNPNLGMREKNLLSLSYGKIKRKDIATVTGLIPASYEGYNIISSGDIVLRLTDLQNDKRSIRVGLAKLDGIVTSAYVTIRPFETCCPDYLAYLILVFDIKKGFYGIGSGVRQGLTYDEIKKLKFIFPPLAEQKRIAEYIDKQVAKIDALIENRKAELERLEALKRSIICECVTGKREVA